MAWAYSETAIASVKVTQTYFKMFLVTFPLFYCPVSLCIVNDML